jgi:hypothetical protein
MGFTSRHLTRVMPALLSGIASTSSETLSPLLINTTGVTVLGPPLTRLDICQESWAAAVEANARIAAM